MGDSTFTAEDVLRIYEFYLDQQERETVELFFATEPEDPINIEFAENLLTRLETLAIILGSNTIGVLVKLFSATASVTLNLALEGLRQSTEILSFILTERSVDA